MGQNEGESSSSGHYSFELAERFSKENNETKQYIEKLEARIRSLEADRTSSDAAPDWFDAVGSGTNPSAYRDDVVPPTKPHVVILVHGIRDRALWQSEVRSSLRAAGFIVALTDYGRIDIARFLFPLSFFRNSVVKKIRDQIRTIKLQHPMADISIIAHSFGTYVVSRVMREEFDIVFNRIVFCGGVFPQNIPFEQFSNRFLPPIVNEVGAHDFWPAVANSVTWGYGASGTFGFRKPLFEDRWHNDPGHNFFLTSAFSNSFWVPFMNNGTIIDGESSPQAPHRLVEMISNFHIKYAILCFLFLILFIILYFKYT